MLGSQPGGGPMLGSQPGGGPMLGPSRVARPARLGMRRRAAARSRWPSQPGARHQGQRPPRRAIAVRRSGFGSGSRHLAAGACDRCRRAPTVAAGRTRGQRPNLLPPHSIGTNRHPAGDAASLRGRPGRPATRRQARPLPGQVAQRRPVAHDRAEAALVVGEHHVLVGRVRLVVGVGEAEQHDRQARASTGTRPRPGSSRPRTGSTGPPRRPRAGSAPRPAWPGGRWASGVPMPWLMSSDLHPDPGHRHGHAPPSGRARTSAPGPCPRRGGS